MNTTKKLKGKLNLISSNSKSKDNLIGLRFFHIGILLLAAAPLISFFLLTISSVIGTIKRKDNFFNDNYNSPFLIAAILMTINCVLITIRADIIDNQDPTLAWIGILNWIPFFWCFWSFQIYLNSGMLRIKAAK